MTLVKSKSNGNGNGNMFPKIVNDFFSSDFFRTPTLFDFDKRLSGMGVMEVPSVNIVENEKDFSIELAAPGLKKEDFKIEVDNGMLSISAEKEKEENEENKNYRRKEYSYQSFCRSFELPQNSLPNDIVAHYENGVLNLTLPKKEATTSKTKKSITVE